MTQQDKDCEVFESAFANSPYSFERNPTDERYWYGPTDFAYEGWRAACDHYAPKLTERNAVELAAQAIKTVLNKEFAKTNVTTRQAENAAIAAFAPLACGLRRGHEELF